MTNSTLKRILESGIVDSALQTAQEFIEAGAAEDFAVIMKSLAIVAKLEGELGGVVTLEEPIEGSTISEHSPYAEVIKLGQRSRRA